MKGIRYQTTLKYLTIPVLLAVYLWGCDSVFEPEPENAPVEVFMELWNTFDQKYAVFEQRDVDWDALYDIYRPQVNENTTDAELHDVLTAMLAHLDDAHVSLYAPGEPFWNGHQEFREPTTQELFDFDVIVQNYLGGRFSNIDNQVIYGTIDDEVGYIFFNHFRGDELVVIDEILEEMRGVRGIVIDLRRNAGGDFTNGQVVASRFADQRRLAFSAIPKDGPGPNDYADPVDYFIEPDGPTQFSGSVAVLADRFTISAGESVLLFFREIPGVTVYGERTAGAMGERIEKELPNGWIYSITGQIIVAADGNSYEGPGIPPDIAVTNTIDALGME